MRLRKSGQFSKKNKKIEKKRKKNPSRKQFNLNRKQSMKIYIFFFKELLLKIKNIIFI